MEAFAECTSLKKVSILGEEVDIEYGAFEYCENLSDIEIPGSEAELGCYVFPDTAYYDDEKNWDNGVLYVGNILAATRSEEVKGEYTVREGTRCIADRAFYGCDNLTSITIPKSVTNIGVLQFEGCSSLTAINIESGCENYESRDGVLYGKVLKNLIQCPMKKGGKLVIPKGAVEKIKDEAFGYCTEIEEVIIPEGVTEIGDYAFLNCKNLKSVTIPESVESIGYGAFGSCESLESVIIPKKVESIKDYTFIGCGSLKSVTIPEGVKSIGALAFEECGKLSEAIIPESVTVIGNQAFDGCGSLKKVNIPKGVKVIPEAAFARCESLTDVVIPESVEFIVDSAFADCGSLEKIEIPKGANIGSYAFARCESLKSVSLSEGMESVEYGTFTGCKSLTDIVIPESVTSIGYDAFFECENLKNISFPKGITFVGNGALLNTAYYSDEKNWDNGVLYIGSVLVKAKGISGVYKVGDNVTCIAPYAFEECSNMTGVIIPASVTRIGEGAFLNTAYYNDEKNRDNGVLYSGNILIEANGDDVGVNYSVKNGTVMIADRAFAWNGNIIRISIPESVKLIGEEALYEVYQDISDVYFGGTEEEWRALEERSGSLGLTEEARVHYNSGIKE